jgi:hypothetical protein
VVLPLVSLCAVATLLASASQFPGEFDFRRRVITNLASWRDNPSGHRLFGVGLGIEMLLAVPLVGLWRNLNGARAMLRVGACLGWIGIIGGLILALESGAIAGMRDLWGLHRRAHEMYAIVMFAGVSGWAVCFGFGAIQSALRDGAQRRSARILVPTTLWVTVVGSSLIQLLLYVQVYRRAAGGRPPVGETSFWLHFAFWEWLCAVSVVLLLQAAAWEACHAVQRRQARCGRRLRVSEAGS